MKPVFSKLLKGYPSANHPCDGPWANQCAIRMSVALNAEGTIPIGKNTYSEPKCETTFTPPSCVVRSEERRVGKECCR